MKEALKLALEALDMMVAPRSFQLQVRIKETYDTIAKALAQPEQEPVAYPEGDVVGPCICGSWPGGKCLKCPRITTPPQRTWVGLSLADKEEFLALDFGGNRLDAMDWADQRLKEKNNGT